MNNMLLKRKNIILLIFMSVASCRFHGKRNALKKDLSIYSLFIKEQMSGFFAQRFIVSRLLAADSGIKDQLAGNKTNGNILAKTGKLDPKISFLMLVSPEGSIRDFVSFDQSLPPANAGSLKSKKIRDLKFSYLKNEKTFMPAVFKECLSENKDTFTKRVLYSHDFENLKMSPYNLYFLSPVLVSGKNYGCVVQGISLEKLQKEYQYYYRLLKRRFMAPKLVIFDKTGLILMDYANPARNLNGYVSAKDNDMLKHWFNKGGSFEGSVEEGKKKKSYLIAGTSENGKIEVDGSNEDASEQQRDARASHWGIMIKIPEDQGPE